MIPPVPFQRGAPISADNLNTLVEYVKQNTLRPGIGYTLNQTPGGTSLSISPPNSSGGGAGTVDAPCSFRVTDVSERDEDGNLILKLNVKCEPIQPSGRWPTGTSEESPNKVYNLGERAPGWFVVYIQINVDQQNSILEGDDGINIYDDTKWVEGSSVNQITYLAGVTISADTENKSYISYIENYCPAVTIKPAPSCPFLIESYGNSVPPKISIRSSTIQRNYPTGMDAVNTYTLEIPDTQDWFVVYAYLVTDSNGNIQFGENDVTLGLDTEYRTSTTTLTYFPLGEINVGYTAEPDPVRVIDYIYNACTTPFISGAVDQNGNIIPRGKSASCPFEVVNASTSETTGILAPYGVVSGFEFGPQYVTIEATTYVYVAINYVPTDTVVSSVEYHFSTSLTANTTDIEYVLIAIVSFNGESITSISNQCQNITPNPCNLNWSV